MSKGCLIRAANTVGILKFSETHYCNSLISDARVCGLLDRS